MALSVLDLDGGMSMTSDTHEHTLNVALGEVLGLLRGSWTTRSEQTGQVLKGGGRPDVLIEEASGWPVVIEAKVSDHANAEADAIARLGRIVGRTGRQIETSIALVYPPTVRSLDGLALREALNNSKELEYALYTRRPGSSPDRMPSHGWIKGGARELARLVHRAAVPPPRIEDLAVKLENGVKYAADDFTRRHPHGSQLGANIAGVLGQFDDNDGQTRRMAMTVIANALVFHESLAEAQFQIQIQDEEGGHTRAVRPVDSFRVGGTFGPGDVVLEWERILEVNYWPIFWSAKEMLRLMPTSAANAVLGWLWQTGQQLVAGGVTRSHDLTGVVFQRLIADRKFLATYYTRPEAAALLAALALPTDSPPGGADWKDEETLASAQIGDFACGTGTLLSMAYQRLSLLHELHGGDPRKLHGPMMRHGLVGLDVLNIAVHLTAAMLAGSHPDTPFDGECLLTMPFGEQASNLGEMENNNVAIGSLDLLAESVQQSLIDTAAAVSAGGRAPEEVRDLVSRVGHERFDVVIMNPPFIRSTGMEAEKRGTGNPAFAAFNTSKSTQGRMQNSLARLRGTAPLGTGNSGLAADFLDLALRKVRPNGMIALVLPLSAVSGMEWEEARQALGRSCRDIIVVTIAGAGSDDSSFSADTDMAECLLIARKGEQHDGKRAVFVMLRQRPNSAIEAELLADEISRIRESDQLRPIERLEGISRIRIGDQEYGVMLNAPLPESGPWPLVGILDEELAQVAWNLERGSLMPLGLPGVGAIEIPIKAIRDIADRGPYHADIYWDQPDGTPRGPFELIKPTASPLPTYPMLWAHDAKRERNLVVEPDSEGRIKPPSGQLTGDDLHNKAARIRATASRAHYNRDLRFNSQSLIVATTERRCIGGRSWPSIIFESADHEYAFALWCNSTLGLLLHWWVSNKTQSGRGTTTITSIPNIPTLDVHTLTENQIEAAKAIFDELKDREFLPFDQIDEDSARAELDRRLLVDVLQLPEWLTDTGGPLELLRQKLAKEPQVHGGKKSRVVFYETTDDSNKAVIAERSVKRLDR